MSQFKYCQLCQTTQLAEFLNRKKAYGQLLMRRIMYNIQCHIEWLFVIPLSAKRERILNFHS